MNTLAGLPLPDECLMTPETEFATAINTTVQPSAISGAPNIWEQQVGGRHIDLIMEAGYGKITRADFVALQQLATVQAGTHTLVYLGVTYSVRFRNEESQLPVMARPLLEYTDVQDADIFTELNVLLMEM